MKQLLPGFRPRCGGVTVGLGATGTGCARALLLVVVAASTGCTAIFDPEGNAAGECQDDADNDGDGLFDCDDPSCTGSDVCAGIAGGDETGAGDSGVEDTSMDDSAPSIRIVSRADGAAVTGCAMVIVELTNIELMDFMTETQPVEGEGHYHLLFEDKYLPCAELYCLIGLESEGMQDVFAQLVHNDHSPYLNDAGEAVGDSVTLNVTAGDCAEGTPSSGY